MRCAKRLCWGLSPQIEPPLLPRGRDRGNKEAASRVCPPRSFSNIVHPFFRNVGIEPGACGCLNVICYSLPWLDCAGVLGRTLGAGFHHTVLSMLHAVCRCLAALDGKGRGLHAGVMCASHSTDVTHAVLGVLSAVSRPFVALHVKTRLPRAVVM